MRLLFGLIVLATFCASAQQTDSLSVSSDTIMSSISAEDESAYKSGDDDHAAADTALVVTRSFDEQTLQKLKADPELQYGIEATVGESLWQRFWRWITDWISSLLNSATTTNFGRLAAYLFLFISLIVIIMMILKVNTMHVFYGDGASPVQQHAFDENIHEMDFDRLIRDALSKEDYRLGVRLIFLHALKMLSDKNHIHWMQGKTNHDYLSELEGNEVKAGFSELNYFFEYAWYGNFSVTNGVYQNVRKTFDNWRMKV